jgi:hypothetical protein
VYCPCCGSKTSESASFCRSCGADSQTICDTLEGRIPTTAAARLLLRKIQDRLARRTEFFRLQTLAATSWTLAFIGFRFQAELHHRRWPLSTPLFVSFLALLLYADVWSCLKYSRSKAFFARSSRKDRRLPALFCPRCGTRSLLEANYCKSCGQSFERISEALRGRPSRLARRLDSEIARADRAVTRMSRAKLTVATLASLILSLFFLLATMVGAYSMMDGLIYLLTYAPTCLINLQMVLTRRRERALWGPVKSRENAARIVDWLALNAAAFEEQCLSEEVLTSAVGLHPIEAAEAALDLLENQEVIVRQPVKTRGDSSAAGLTMPAGGLLLRPGRYWPQTRASLLRVAPSLRVASEGHSLAQPPSLAAPPTHAFDDPSTQPTQPLPRPIGPKR